MRGPSGRLINLPPVLAAMCGVMEHDTGCNEMDNMHPDTLAQTFCRRPVVSCPPLHCVV